MNTKKFIASLGLMVGLTAAVREAKAIEPPVYVGPHAIGMSWVEEPDQVIHGLAVDDRFIFSTLLPVPFGTAPAVKAYSRLTGEDVATLPPPPGGWFFPFMMQCDPQHNKLYVWDGGGFPLPPPFIQQPFLSVYKYRGTNASNFHADLIQTVDFRGSDFGIGWAADIELLPDGSLATSDSIFGAIWRLHPDTGEFEMVVGPETPTSPTVPSYFPPLSVGPYPAGYTGSDVDGVPFFLFGADAPGANYLAYRDGYLYFTNAAHQAIERIDVSVFDDARTPTERADDIETVSTRPAGDQVEVLGGMTFNQYRPSDPWLYVADAFNVRVMRVNVDTGARETVLRNGTLFNLPVAVEFGPPVLGITPLFVASDQEHRFSVINPAIPHDLFQPPWRIGKLLVSPH